MLLLFCFQTSAYTPIEDGENAYLDSTDLSMVSPLILGDCLPLNQPTSFAPSQYSPLSVCISRQFQRRWFPAPCYLQGWRGHVAWTKTEAVINLLLSFMYHWEFWKTESPPIFLVWHPKSFIISFKWLEKK